MKICWDNLERVKLSNNGDFRIGRDFYVEVDSCKMCGDSYLTSKYNQGPFCSTFCARKNTIMYGIRLYGSLNGNYKGGVAKAGWTTYAVCKNRLGLYEDIREQKNTGILEAKCVYCGHWFVPTSIAINNRLTAINNLDKGECRLYCSENCKQACPTYKQRKYPKGFKKATSREVSTYLRQMVFERDNWECQKCGKGGEEVALHCHHIEGYAQNKILANDIDNCITLCKNCHKEVHMQQGCRYVDLQCGKE
jgi:5-methylcytosine-specific restriction endonuclease McrA